MAMLQANLYDNFDDEGLGWSLSSLNPISAIKDAGSWVGDKVVDAAQASYSGVKTAGSYVLDKTCGAAVDPRVQAATAAAALVPSGYSQAGAGAVMATGAACSVFYPANMPAPPIPPLATSPLQPPMVLQTKFQRYVPPGTAAPAAVPGMITAFDPKRGGYRVAVPGLPGFSAPAAFTEVGTQATKPAGAQLVALKTFETQTGATKPWYKNPLVLGGIAAGVLVVGGGGYMLMRD